MACTCGYASEHESAPYSSDPMISACLFLAPDGREAKTWTPSRASRASAARAAASAASGTPLAWRAATKPAEARRANPQPTWPDLRQIRASPSAERAVSSGFQRSRGPSRPAQASRRIPLNHAENRSRKPKKTMAARRRDFPAGGISRPVHSTALPPLRVGDQGYREARRAGGDRASAGGRADW
jgi:hypothetical protein